MRLCFDQLYMMFSYFSVWTDMQFLLFQLESSPILRRHLMPSTFLCLCISSVGGLYITHVRPRRLHVPYLDHTFEGLSLCLMDVLGHHLLLLYFFFVDMKPLMYKRRHAPTLSLRTLFLPFCYFMAELPHHQLYGLSTMDMTIIAFLSLVLHHTLLVHYDAVLRLVQKLDSR